VRHPRVAIVAPSLDIVGGQGVQARALAEALRGDGWSVDFIPVNPTFPRGLRWVRRHRGVRTVLNQALYVPSLARLRRADVVHVFSASYWSFLLAPVPAMLAARLGGARVVLNYHSGEAEDHLGRWGALVHPWLRLADTLVVPSAYLRDVFARHGLAARVIPNIVDLERFRHRERSPLRPRLVSSRNLEPYYRVDATLDAFALLSARHPDATLMVAGSGSLEASLRDRARALGDGRIRFVGRVEPPAMPALYDAADIFVNASVLDNQPVSILEAFASGLPVVSTPVGAIGDLVRDGETGLLVPPLDPAAMAKAVERLLEDDDLARDLARRARAQAEAFTWPRVRPQWHAVYTERAA
jgi:glycosyltransferase involved in cell wall biosynthesis